LYSSRPLHYVPLDRILVLVFLSTLGDPVYLNRKSEYKRKWTNTFEESGIDYASTSTKVRVVTVFKR